jgi:hypothetical protein
MDDTRTPCRHCNRKPACRPKGLCWGCYQAPGVRDAYPSTSKFARRGEPDRYGRPPPPDAPTAHEPGTPGKVAVLCERAANRQALWHPGDALCCNPALVRGGRPHPHGGHHKGDRPRRRRREVAPPADDELARYGLPPDAGALCLPARTARDTAEGLLRLLLADGPQPARLCYDLARRLELSEATLRRAKLRLGVKAVRVGTGDRHYHSRWRLPA